MSDEIGSVMMDAEEELVMPEIPVKANNAIPVAIGILLVLGSLFGALLSASMMLTLTVDDEARNQAGFGPEENATLDLLQETGMAETLTIMYGSMAIGLLVGGIMLMRKNPLGVKVSVFGSSMFILTNLVQVIWTYLVADSYGISFSLGADLIIFFGCGAFCVALPLLAIMIPEGRAALYREPVGIYFGEEDDHQQAPQEKLEMQDELEKEKSSTVVQNITYNIQDNAIVGDINIGQKEKDVGLEFLNHEDDEDG